MDDRGSDVLPWGLAVRLHNGTCNSNCWLGFAAVADLGEEVGWYHNFTRSSLHLGPIGPALELELIVSAVTHKAASHPFSPSAALSWFLGIPAPFALTLRELQ